MRLKHSSSSQSNQAALATKLADLYASISDSNLQNHIIPLLRNLPNSASLVKDAEEQLDAFNSWYSAVVPNEAQLTDYRAQLKGCILVHKLMELEASLDQEVNKARPNPKEMVNIVDHQIWRWNEEKLVTKKDLNNQAAALEAGPEDVVREMFEKAGLKYGAKQKSRFKHSQHLMVL
ncbi:hypothetical protein BJ508DRAFT_335510 [Ascobolus immersus RN42]|uniref:Uncharacterized protein n=1 Tax=Ascobolus immersus RN42 TaxID=1160509 RepID=A0A3N4HC63_ASCIM|nr:hypothetical protein BJ508DRAFT_335510 [Ascobolus immersus RN42]